MTNIVSVIFSRDRAMQLDAVLRSLSLHCQDAEDSVFCVLYEATSECHEKQYQELIKEYSGRVNFKRQQNFRQDLFTLLTPFKRQTIKRYIFFWLHILGKIGPPLESQFDRVWRRTVSPILVFLSKLLIVTVSKDKFLLFLVDDNLFVRDFYLRKVTDVLRKGKKILGFSLRLGENTTYCYPMKRNQLIPELDSLGADVACFAWPGSDGDFGYPLEISSSIYRLRDILPILMGFSFNNPSDLEERMAFSARYFWRKQPYLACYQNSVAFCNPVNMVQSVIPNRAGEKVKYDTNDLSARFDRGDRIQIEAYSGFVPESCHQEVELFFRKSGELIT